MNSKAKAYQQLLSLWAEIDDLKRVLDIISWDEQTQMPKSGAKARANHKATLNRLIHEKTSSVTLGQLCEELHTWAQSFPSDSDERAVVNLAQRAHEKAVKLSPDLVMETSAVRSQAFLEWLKAREVKDFKVFAPSLQRVYEVSRKTAEALGYQGHPLNALLDLTEPGMTVDEVEGMFVELKDTLVPLSKAIFQRQDDVSDAFLNQHYERQKQWEIGIDGVKAIGFKLDEGRADESVHPFSTTFSPQDVRITTRIKEKQFAASFFAFLHEAGHGHYMQGIPKKYGRTPLTEGASHGVHESQSRTWENIVGRSRGFGQHFYPKVQAMFPKQTRGYSTEDWYKAVNRVRPSFIRVEADEVTYNLHIMIRYELEKAVYDGKIGIFDLAEAWNAKFQDYLGITPKDDLVGVLQDIHWSMLGFGATFQSYAIGNVMSVQFFEAALRAQPSLAEAVKQGDYQGLLQWSRDNIHAHGAKYKPLELVKVVTGRPLSSEPYCRYITKKFSEIYQL